MDKEHDKLMTDLERLLKTQDFKSEEEVKKFINGIMNDPIPAFPKEALTPAEQAQDLIFEAYKLPPLKAKLNVEKALQLNPDCIEAYEYKVSQTSKLEKAIPIYMKGIEIGRRLYGGDYLKENKGHFWGLHETRPFMRCLHGLSDCLFAKGKVKESTAILEEMIELNPNDNQGVRDQLLLYLILLNENDKFEHYNNIFENENMTSPLFNRALFAFKKEGSSENANNKLRLAIEKNKYVPALLLSKKQITGLPETYSIGSIEEAAYYSIFAQIVWQKTFGAIKWLKQISEIK